MNVLNVKVAVAAVLLVGAVWLAVRPVPPGSTESSVTYVSLGDSVASGHGLDTAPAPKPGEQTYVPGVGCQRSDGDSYPNLVATALEDRYARVRHEQLACSGHTTAEVLTLQLPRAEQVLAAAGAGPAIVTLTAGANNYNFWDPRSYVSVFDPNPAAFDQWRQGIEAGVRRDVTATLARLGRDRADRLLLVTEYFNPFNAAAAVFELSTICRDAAACAARTATTMDGLNQALRAAVADYTAQRQANWAPAGLVGGVAAAFRDHGAPRPFCGAAPPDAAASWIQSPRVASLVSSLVGQLRVGPGNDCFHPNPAGHRELARLTLAALDQLRGR